MSLENRMSRLNSLRDWSLITGRGGGGGGTKQEGGGVSEVLPLRKWGGGGRKSFSHAEGGTTRVCMW